MTFSALRSVFRSVAPATWMRQFQPSAQFLGMPSMLDTVMLLAAPKSKISPSRKRQKHDSYFPDKVAWVRCNKCGEAKRPHRICTEHVDICAMRDEEYQEHLKNKVANPEN